MTAYGTYDDIGVTLDNLVAIIEIQRPPNNFFDIALINQIAHALEKLDADEDCRASVL